MATPSLVTEITARYIGQKANPITDQETGEITQMTKFEFIAGVYIDELQSSFSYDKLPSSDPTYTAYVMNNDQKQLAFFAQLKVGAVYKLEAVPLAKGGNRRGASGVKYKFVGEPKQIA